MWLIDGVKLKVVLTLYVLADCRHEPAVAYLKRQRRWLQKSDTQLTVLVEDMFLAVGTNQLANLLNFDNHDDIHTLRAATRTTPIA